MINIKWMRTKRQTEAWDYLSDQITSELLFVGGAGGGKSLLGCAWLIIMCGKYPETRWLLGRSKLKTLKETTLATFFDVCKMWGIKEGYYKYNANEGTITFTNGSQILLKDLFMYPSDPNFDSLGSLEITGAFIDEVNQITFRAWSVVKSRIRYKLDQYGLIPKLLGTCNPSKNWVYQEFYKPHNEGTLPNNKKFVQALVKDNPFISKYYVENLKQIKDKAIKERLLMGNWNYDDDPSCIFSYDTITDLFTNKGTGDEKYIVGDVARKGRDRMVIGYWEGLQLKQVYELDYETKSDTKKSTEFVINLAEEKQVGRSNIVLDEDGVGGGVVDQVECKGFVNGSACIQPPEVKYDSNKKLNYGNLKAQCYLLLADKAEKSEIGIDSVNPDIKDLIVEELEQIKRKNLDKDGKIYIISKEEIKEAIGRSPDFADMIMMRMFFELEMDLEPSITII